MENTISVVIGSWGSYNECNERALGSSWLELNSYTDFEEIRQKLQLEGFELDGLDEELFIQDIEGICNADCNWDYVNPETLFNRLYESGVLKDVSKYEMMEAYLENATLQEFFDLVEEYGEDWDGNMILRADCKDWDDYGREILSESSASIPEDLERFFDFEDYGESMARYSNTYLTDYGVLEVFE